MWGERARASLQQVSHQNSDNKLRIRQQRWKMEVWNNLLCLRFSLFVVAIFFSSNFSSLFPTLLITRYLLQSKQKLVLLYFIPWDATRWFKTSKHQLIYLYTIMDVIDISAPCRIPSWSYSRVLQSLCFAFFIIKYIHYKLCNQLFWKIRVNIWNISINFKNALMVCSFSLMTAALNLHELPCVACYIES